MKWMPAIRHTARVPPTVVAPSPPRDHGGARSRGPTLRTSGPASASRVQLSSVDADPHGAVDHRHRRRHGPRLADTLLAAQRGLDTVRLRAARGRPARSQAPPRPGRGSAPAPPRGASLSRPEKPRVTWAPGTRRDGHRPMLHSAACRGPQAPRSPAGPSRARTIRRSRPRCGARTAGSRSARTAWCSRPVGIKCRDCARLPRSARATLRPDRAVRSVLVSFGVRHAVRAAAGRGRDDRTRVLQLHHRLRRRAGWSAAPCSGPAGGTASPTGLDRRRRRGVGLRRPGGRHLDRQPTGAAGRGAGAGRPIAGFAAYREVSDDRAAEPDAGPALVPVRERGRRRAGAVAAPRLRRGRPRDAPRPIAGFEAFEGAPCWQHDRAGAARPRRLLDSAAVARPGNRRGRLHRSHVGADALPAGATRCGSTTISPRQPRASGRAGRRAGRGRRP